MLGEKVHPALKAVTIAIHSVRQTPTEVFKGELTMTRIPMTSSKTPGMKNARPRLRTNALFTADLRQIKCTLNDIDRKYKLHFNDLNISTYLHNNVKKTVNMACNR